MRSIICDCRKTYIAICRGSLTYTVRILYQDSCYVFYSITEYSRLASTIYIIVLLHLVRRIIYYTITTILS